MRIGEARRGRREEGRRVGRKGRRGAKETLTSSSFIVRANQCFGGSFAGGSLPVELRSSASSATKSLYRLLTDHERVGVDTACQWVTLIARDPQAGSRQLATRKHCETWPVNATCRMLHATEIGAFAPLFTASQSSLDNLLSVLPNRGVTRATHRPAARAWCVAVLKVGATLVPNSFPLEMTRSLASTACSLSLAKTNVR